MYKVIRSTYQLPSLRVLSAFKSIPASFNTCKTTSCTAKENLKSIHNLASSKLHLEYVHLKFFIRVTNSKSNRYTFDDKFTPIYAKVI